MAFPRILVMAAIFASISLARAQPAPPGPPSAETTRVCRRPPTVAEVNFTAYGGRWFEIGTSARFKLQRENGLVCNQARYSINGASSSATNGSTGGSAVTSIGVENSGRLVVSPAVLQSASSVAGGNRDACIALVNISSTAGSALQLLQSHPQSAASCSQVNVTSEFLNIEATARTIASTVTTMAALSVRISQLDFRNASLDRLASQLLLHASSSADQASQIAQAASRVLAASSDCSASSSSSSSNGTWSAVSAAAASIASSANSLRDALNRVAAAVSPYAGSDALSTSWASVASIPLPFGGIPTTVYGQAVPSSSDPAKLTVNFAFFPSTTEPNYWILALQGRAEQGYSAALVYSCSEPEGSDPAPRFDVFVISREPTMGEEALEELLDVLPGYGIELGCDNPFVLTVQDAGRCSY